LLQRLVRAAQESEREAVVITFHPHPDRVLAEVDSGYMLTSPEVRAQFLLQLGIELVVTLPFDEKLRQVAAADFVAELVQKLRMTELWVGADFALGYKREGDLPTLRALGRECGFRVHPVDLLLPSRSGKAISSTRIRQALKRGDVEEANALLGRAYAVQGRVERGRQLGRSIGFPTANLGIWAQQLLPASGVYATWARLGHERFMAASNIGLAPTFAGKRFRVEAHLLDFAQDIYGQQLELAFVQRLRHEQSFASIEALSAQIAADVEATRQILQSQASPA